MIEHKRAVALDRLAERQPVDSGDDRLQLRATNLQREPAPVLALKLQKVVGDKGRLSRAAIGSQRREVAMAVRPESGTIRRDHRP